MGIMYWDGMSEAEKIGVNIRYHRELHGETQDELAAFLGVTKQTVSNYERGIKTPKKNRLAEIAKYYKVTVDDLMYKNYSAVEGISATEVDRSVITNRFPDLFPIVKTEEAMKNESFNRAYGKHIQFYDELKSEISYVTPVDECFFEYFKAGEIEAIKKYAWANILALWHFFALIARNGKSVYDGSMAFMNQMAKKDEKLNRRILNGPSSAFETNLENIKENLLNPDFIEKVEEVLTWLKHDEELCELADYYYSLQYLYNIIDTGLSSEMNYTVGVEMFKVLERAKNPYAEKLLVFVLDSMMSI